MIYDIAVIGGGPAGMTAALYGLRNGKSVVILEKNGFGGQITYSPKVENFPGTLSMSGNEFADAFLDQIMAQGAEIALETVTGVMKNNSVFCISTEDGEIYQSRSVVVAVGVKHRMLGLDGEKELVGNGISFCAVCDGDFYTGKSVCVIGGGNSALQEAILLAGKCAKVTVLQDLPEFTGEKKLQENLFARENVEKHTDMRIAAILTDDDGNFKGITAENRVTKEKTDFICDGMFIAIGLIPENEIFGGLARLNSYGYFDTDESCATMTDGLFVAGDCRSKTVRQLTTAVSDGAVAALAACRYIDRM